jgi:hypothetical protein
MRQVLAAVAQFEKAALVAKRESRSSAQLYDLIVIFRTIDHSTKFSSLLSPARQSSI